MKLRQKIWQRFVLQALKRRQQRGLEQLEKRLLLAVDVVAIAGSPVFTSDVAADTLTLRLNTDRELQYSTDGINFSRDMDTSTALVEVLVIDSITQIEVNMGAGADSLIIDVSLSDALQVEEIELVAIGGDNEDTLIGPDGNAAWQLTGADSGTLNTWITFSGIENLLGGSSTDTFAILDGGSLSGTINAGAGSDDAVDYSSRNAISNANLITGTASGTGGSLMENSMA
jgi:hypothetical protein